MADLDVSAVADGRQARIGPFRDLVEANLAAGRLRDEGIEATLAGENVAATLGPVYGAAYAGGPFVLVSKQDEATARSIVQSVEAVRRERLNAASPACPHCNHRPTNQVIHRLHWTAILLTIAAAFLIPDVPPLGGLSFLIALGLLLAPLRPQWKCPACRQRFAAAKPVVDLPEDD